MPGHGEGICIRRANLRNNRFVNNLSLQHGGAGKAKKKLKTKTIKNVFLGRADGEDSGAVGWFERTPGMLPAFGRAMIAAKGRFTETFIGGNGTA